MQLIAEESGDVFTVSPFRLRMTPPTDLLVLARDGRLIHVRDGVRQGNVITAHAEQLLRKQGLIPQLFSDPNVADVYPEESTQIDLKVIIEKLDLTRAGTRLLDVGCGVGRLLLPLAESFGARIDGLDVDRASVLFLKDRAPDHARIFHGDAATWSAIGQYGDAFSAMNTLRYLGSRARVRAHLKSMFHSLTPGGRYLINMSFNDEFRGANARSWTVGETSYSWSNSSYDPIDDQLEERVTVTSGDELIHDEFQLQFVPKFTDFLNELRIAGWTVTDVYDAYGQSLREGSDDYGSRWILAQRPDFY